MNQLQKQQMEMPDLEEQATKLLRIKVIGVDLGLHPREEELLAECLEERQQMCLRHLYFRLLQATLSHSDCILLLQGITSLTFSCPFSSLA